MDVFWTLPPVSRTITAAAVVVSALGYGGIISLYNVVFASQLVFTTKMFPQLWRVVTAFLITKPKFAILLDPYFLYQYGSSIERESSRFSQPGDFFVYTMFVGSVIVVSTHCSYSTLSHNRVHVRIASTHLSATQRLRSPSPRHICPPSQKLI
jgi:Derlin-2/3